MADIITRAGKGLPLTDPEVDGNFTNLNRELVTTTKNAQAWVASTPLAIGLTVFVDNRYYLVTTAGTTGTVAPSHIAGTQANGTTQLQFFTPAPYSPKDVMDKVRSLDGAGSNLDADLLDGLQATQIIDQAVSDSLALAIALG